MARSKDKIIILRVTPQEKENWKSKAKLAGLNLSEYLRRCASRRQISPKTPEVNYLLAVQLRQIGNNLNQQVKAMNTALKLGQDISNSEEAIRTTLEVQELLKTIQAELQNLTNLPT
jgi:hypothetical protein